MPTIPSELKPQISRMFKELDRRAKKVTRNNLYIEGEGCPIPDVIVKAKLKNAYKVLVPQAQAAWGGLVVDVVQDRLEVTGIRSDDEANNDLLWGVWQDNDMDAESKLAHNGALSHGRAFATVWPSPKERESPEIVLDDAAHVVVEYIEGRHRSRFRTAALRRWKDDDGRVHATLYRPEAIYKFSEAEKDGRGEGRFKLGDDGWWEARQPDGEDWPVENPYGVVPVVEIGTNRRLSAGRFPYARGEFEHCIGLIDRINLLTFLGLVVALWTGFPLRGIIGEEVARRVLKDDDGNDILDSEGKPTGEPIPPIDNRPGSVALIENPDATTFEFKAADRSNLSIFAELDQLAAVTKTPRHYLPIGDGISNIAEPTIRAFEGGLHAKVRGIHKPFLGEGWEEVLRISGLMMDVPVTLSRRAELDWADHESRSLAERADAAVKLASMGLPAVFIAEEFLGLTQEQVTRMEAVGAGSVLGQLLDAAATPATPVTDDEQAAA